MKLGRKTFRGVVQVVAIGAIDGRDYPITDDDMDASWAESEACLREVAGEVIVRGVNVNVLMCSAYITRKCGEDRVEGKDESRPVALLRAFVAAFGSEPRHE